MSSPCLDWRLCFRDADGRQFRRCQELTSEQTAEIVAPVHDFAKETYSCLYMVAKFDGASSTEIAKSLLSTAHFQELMRIALGKGGCKITDVELRRFDAGNFDSESIEPTSSSANDHIFIGI